MSEEHIRKIPKFSRADIIALIALLISFFTLFVSIEEARIMREQQELMQAQQKASVFPYLSQDQNYKFGEDKGEFTYTIENKGVGPAQIKEVKLHLNGETMENYNELNAALKEIFPDSTSFALYYTNISTYFLSAKEAIVPIRIIYDSSPKYLDLISTLSLNYEICYCSIYNDCWSIKTNSTDSTTGCK